MAKCPKCQNPLKEDFGLETCSGCGEVVFVAGDEVSIQGDEELYEEGTIVNNSDTPPPAPLTTPDLSENKNDLEDLFSDIEIETESSFNNNSDLLINEDKVSETLDSDEVAQDSNLFLESDDLLEDQFMNSEGPQSEPIVEPVVSSENLVPTSADDFLEEMQLFGEMDSEKFKDAIYFFDLEIASIDSKETRDEILSLLDDEKLALSLENPGQKIKKGILLLKSIPAVKAYIIVQRIAHLPCELSWTLVEAHDLTADLPEDAEDLNNDFIEEDSEADLEDLPDEEFQ